MFNAGDCLFVLGELQHSIISMNLLYRWDYTLIFGGCPSKEKKRNVTNTNCGMNKKTISIVFSTPSLPIFATYMCVIFVTEILLVFCVSCRGRYMQVGNIQTKALPLCGDLKYITFSNHLVLFVNNVPWVEYRLTTNLFASIVLQMA